jgi:perosamine synthetase
MIPIARPDFGPEETAAVAEVLASGMVAQGRRVAELEQDWADFVGVKHAIAMSNGTVSLMSIFAGIGLGPGDEVITVSHTFAATANAILFTGATPVFVDIEPDTYLIDAKKIEAAITPRTRAICPVHLFGLVADMDMILAIADRHGLVVVEDACQAHGALFRGRPAGSFGHGAFSLYATKNMTTAEGGFVTTNDDQLADWLRLYRNQGMRARYQFEMLGYNFRMTDIAAAIGIVQFDKLERNTARRRQVAAGYDAALAGLPVRLPVTPEGRTHVFHQYTVDVGAARDAILEDLRASGVGADVYYPVPVHRQAYILERGLHADLPVTDAAAARTVALPMYPGLSEEDQKRVVEAFRTAVERHIGATGPAELATR